MLQTLRVTLHGIRYYLRFQVLPEVISEELEGDDDKKR